MWLMLAVIEQYQNNRLDFGVISQRRRGDVAVAGCKCALKDEFLQACRNGLFTLGDTENDTATDSGNYGFHCNVQNTSQCTETLSLMPLATFSHFIGLATYIVLGVAQCEHTIMAGR